MKKGRPKNLKKAQNRKISVILEPLAYELYAKQCHLQSRMGRKQPGKWLHSFISQEIIKKFSKGKESILIQDVLNREQEARIAEEKLRTAVEKLRNYKEDQKSEENSQELLSNCEHIGTKT